MIDPSKKRRMLMYGAILGDMIGRPYEFLRAVKDRNFELFNKRSVFSDDSVMTIAVAEALLKVTDGRSRAFTTEDPDIENRFKEILIDSLKKWGRRYPDAGYGGRFMAWLLSDKREPYNSYGNGSAMRVSAAGYIADDLETTIKVAAWTAEVTHNHHEGVKGAEAVAACIFMARTGCTKEEIKGYVESTFHYDLSRTVDEIKPGYSFDVSCQGSVPESIICFLEGDSFESAVRNAVYLGGDTDTMGAIAGSIAEAYYGVPESLKEECRKRVTPEMLKVLTKFMGE